MSLTLRTNTQHGSVVFIVDLGFQLEANGADPVTTSDENVIADIVSSITEGSLAPLIADNAYPGSPDLTTNTVLLVDDDTGLPVDDPSAFLSTPVFVGSTSGADGAQGIWPKPLTGQQNEVMTLGKNVVPIEEVLKLDFDFSTVTPLNFESLGLGDIVTNLQVIVKQVFDDVAAFVTVGTVLLGAGSIMAIGDVDLTTIGVYEDPNHYEVSGADQLRLVVSPGTSSQGQGRVLATVRRT